MSNILEPHPAAGNSERPPNVQASDGNGVATDGPAGNGHAPAGPRLQGLDVDLVRETFSHLRRNDKECMEVRIFGADLDTRHNVIRPAAKKAFAKTYTGFYTDADRFVADVARARCVSVYVGLNPIRPVRLNVANNRLKEASQKDADAGKDGDAASDEDAVCLRTLFLDFDVKKPLSDISTTDEERAKALALRDRVLAENPEIRKAALSGSSGNAAFAFVALPDYPNDEEHRALLTHGLASLAHRYGLEGRDEAWVDQKARNPSRVGPLPGTLKTKGDPTLERPWRLATIDHRPEPGATLDLKDYVRRFPPPAPAPPSEPSASPAATRPTRPTRGGEGDRLARRRAALVKKLPGAISGQRGHKQTIKSMKALVQLFETEAEAYRFALEHYNPKCEPPWSEAELRRKVSEAVRTNPGALGAKLREDGDHREARRSSRPPRDTSKSASGDAPAGDVPPAKPRSPNRPEIECYDRSLQLVTEDTLRCLAARNDPPETFNVGGSLGWMRMADGEMPYPIIEAMGADAIRNRLAEVATFIETRMGKDGPSEPVEIFPPRDIVRAVRAQKEFSIRVAPPLDSVAAFPRFLTDGRLITTRGYHRDARVYYHPTPDIEGIDVPPIPKPHEVDAAKALIFDDYLCDFPFDGPTSKANALACMLVPFVRLVIPGPTPMHEFGASTEGTGKGKLANACAFPSIGRPLSASSQKEDEAEWRKALTSTLMTGDTHLYLDNMNNPTSWEGVPLPIGSGNLAKALTEEYWQDRQLGFSRDVRVRVRCTWLCSGNNLEWSRELARRIVPIRLRATQENPSERTNFKHDPLEEWARKNRRALLRACLILCQNWFAEDKPPGKQVMGSYEDYARVMGGILDAAMVEGFLGHRIKASAGDRESIRWKALVEAWYAKFGMMTTSAGQLHDMIFVGDPTANPPTPGNIDLQVSFADVFGDGKPLSRKQKLGNALAKYQDRVWGDFRIVQSTAKGPGGVILYKLVDPKAEGD